MNPNPKRFPVPIIWTYLFTGFSFALLYLLSTLLETIPTVKHPGRILLISAFVVFPFVFLVFHRVCITLEKRGYIYYKTAKSGGLAAVTVLDLEIWFTGRNKSVEIVRAAREAQDKTIQQDSEGNTPPEERINRAQ